MNRRSALLGAAALGAIAFATPGLAGPEYKNHLGGETAISRDCNDGDEVVFAGDQTLWPPNHKASPFTVTADATGANGEQEAPSEEAYDDDGEDATITVSGTSDETVNGEELPGSGKPNDGADVEPATAGPTGDQAVVNSSATAERSGTGDGRTYTIEWTATFGENKICTSQMPGPNDREFGKTYVEGDPFLIEVPHDMRVDKDA